jgi:predicted metal-dependent hydrolase
MEYDPRYRKGWELFNTREFFDAHEVWEELWHQTHGESREFIQGLIQAATALHHFQNSNLKGAKLLYQSLGELLSPYPARYMGVDLGKFKAEMEACFKGLAPYAVEALPGRYDPDKEKFPIQVDESKIPVVPLPSPATERDQRST